MTDQKPPKELPQHTPERLWGIVKKTLLPALLKQKPKRNKEE